MNYNIHYTIEKDDKNISGEITTKIYNDCNFDTYKILLDKLINIFVHEHNYFFNYKDANLTIKIQGNEFPNSLNILNFKINLKVFIINWGSKKSILINKLINYFETLIKTRQTEILELNGIVLNEYITIDLFKTNRNIVKISPKFCKWIKQDVGMFGFHDYEYSTSCGKTYDCNKVTKENFCPNCGCKII